MNTFGQYLRLTIFGESHGPALGVTLDGLPAGIALVPEDLESDLARRRAGVLGTTPRRERDLPEIVSGFHRGHTTGSPLTLLFRNTECRPEDYEAVTRCPRPSHADLVAVRKYGGMNDPRGGGHFSGRLTVALTAAGAVAKKLLPQTRFDTRVVRIGGCDDPQRFEALLREAAAAGDSLGGLVECRARGVPAGTGEPFFDGVESRIAHLLFAIPAVKGVEFGSGMAVADRRGSENDDAILNIDGVTATNHDGGINGGITNGNELVVRAAVKPTPSIALPVSTVDLHTGEPVTLRIGGRHDVCIALRAAVAIEAAVALALADLSLAPPSIFAS